MTRILVAGIGNIFMGDDGFGCEVVRRLADVALPDGIDLVDFGIRGMDLHYALGNGYDLAVLIDTISRNGAPGTLYVIEPEPEPSQSAAADGEVVSPHGMDPAGVLRLVAALGPRAPRVLLVACEPEWLGGEQGHMGLSSAVTACVDTAVDEVQAIVRDARCRNSAPRPADFRMSAY